MLRTAHFLLLLAGFAGCTAARAGDPVTWSFSAAPAGGDTVLLLMRSECAPGWHIYATGAQGDEGPLPTVFNLPPGEGYALAGPLREPVPQEKIDAAFGIQVRLHDGAATFTQPLLRSANGAFTVKGSVEYMACNDKTCLPPQAVPFIVDIPPSHRP